MCAYFSFSEMLLCNVTSVSETKQIKSLFRIKRFLFVYVPPSLPPFLPSMHITWQIRYTSYRESEEYPMAFFSPFFFVGIVFINQ